MKMSMLAPILQKCWYTVYLYCLIALLYCFKFFHLYKFPIIILYILLFAFCSALYYIIIFSYCYNKSVSFTKYHDCQSTASFYRLSACLPTCLSSCHLNFTTRQFRFAHLRRSDWLQAASSNSPPFSHFGQLCTTKIKILYLHLL